MESLPLLLGGLAALCLPGWLGLAVAAAALGRCLRRRRAAAWGSSAGLVLLACAPHVAGVRPAAAAPPPHVTACLVEGRWRTPPGQPQRLDTAAGSLSLAFAEGVRTPLPGQPLRAWLRVDPEGRPQAVAWQPTGEVSGAWLDRWARVAAARCRALVGRDDAGLLAALVLGQRVNLPWSLRAACSASGTSHVLAISGMHVALLAGVLGVVSASGSWRRRALLLGAFCTLAGSAAPVVRSWTGWLLSMLSLRLARPADGLHRLAAVALLLECWQPGLHLQPSAQLSFLAVAGLVAASRLGPAALAAWLAPLGAMAATAPLCVELFGRFQPLGVLVTPLLAPPLAIVMATSVLAVLPGPFLALLDPLLAPVLRAALGLLRGLIEFAAAHGPPPLVPGPPPLPGVVLSLLVVAALVALGRVRPGRALEVAA